jgi:hypothetical protein
VVRIATEPDQQAGNGVAHPFLGQITIGTEHLNLHDQCREPQPHRSGLTLANEAEPLRGERGHQIGAVPAPNTASCDTAGSET